MKRNSGFTLIELLIVVAILGILGAILFVAIGGNPQRDARDSTRIATISQLQLALELCKADSNCNGGYYPDTLADLKTAGFIGSVPSDPQGNAFSYAVSATNDAYHLGIALENGSNKALCGDADITVAAQAGWTGAFAGNGSVDDNICAGGTDSGDASPPIYDVRS